MYIFLFISLNQFQGHSGISIAFGVILVGIFSFGILIKVCFVFWYCMHVTGTPKSQSLRELGEAILYVFKPNSSQIYQPVSPPITTPLAE